MKLPEPKTIELKCFAHQVNRDENEINTIKASIKNLNLLKNDELKNNPSFLFFEADLANAGKINKNGHGMTIEEAVRVYKKWEYGFINTEHSREDVCGVIIKSALTDPETKQILTEEEALSYKKPINISIAFIIWESVDPNLSQILKEVGNIDNPSHGLISLSLELAYNAFDIYQGEPSNMFEGNLISSEEEIEKLYKYLKDFEGNGVDENGKEIYLIAQDTIPLGAGLVVKPAADVKGIKEIKAQDNESDDDDDDDDEEEKHDDDCECELCEKNKKMQSKIQELEEKIKNLEIKGSQLEKNNVSTNSMKIKHLSEITDESIKEIKASDVATFIADEIGKASEEAIKNLEAKELELTNAKELAEKASKEAEEIKSALEKVNKELEEIKSARLSEQLEASFNNRMSSLDEEFELDDASREAIASQIRNLNDEEFEGWKKSFDIFAKEKNKEVIKTKKDEEDKNKMEKEKEMKSKEIAASFEDPLDEIVVKLKANIPSSVEMSKDVLDSYKEAFEVGKGMTFEL